MFSMSSIMHFNFSNTTSTEYRRILCNVITLGVIFSKAEGQIRNRRKRFPGQLVEIPSEFEKQVTGKGGDNLRNISTLTGAKVFSRGNKQYELKGTAKGVKHAELLLKRRVVCSQPF